jgi:hypothetical protein
MLSMLLPSLMGMPRRWRNSNSGLLVSPTTRAGDWRSHPTPWRTLVIGKARELMKRAVDSTIRADSKETGAEWQAIAAQREAAYGYAAEARKSAAEALKLAPMSPAVGSEVALAFAMAGDTAKTESLSQDLGKRFPLGTQMQSLWLPANQALLALDRRNPASALNALQAATHIELGEIGFVLNISCLYPTYIRGEAYLAAGQGSAAVAEFQNYSRSQRHRLELLDGCVGAFGRGSCQCFAVENLARCRCRPCKGARRLQKFLRPLERRRPRHPNPETS